MELKLFTVIVLCTLSLLIGISITYLAFFHSTSLILKRLSKDELLHELNDIVLVFSQNGKLVYANRRAYSAMGYDSYALEKTADAVIEEKAKDFLSMSDGDEKEYDGKTYVLTAKDVYKKAKPFYHIIKLTDVTEERKHLQEVTELKQQADAANLAKSMFLAHMSHEIRTPINSIIGMDEMILRESNEGNVREYASDVMKSGKTLITLVNDLIEYSKIESGKLEVSPDYYQLEHLFKEIYTIMHFKSSGKRLSLIIDIDPSTPRSMYGDEIRIRQILTQLVDNAIKYTEKGTVSVTVSYDRIDDMNVNLTIDVRDTGVGMKPDDLKKMLGDFGEVTDDSARRLNGTGLGMTIVRKLLKMMNGTISVESIPNLGTSFHIILPQIISDPAEIGRISFQDEINKDKRVDFKAPTASVLVVDDIKTNRTIAKLLVKNTGIKFDESESGEKALEMIKAKHYDLILLDQRMPGLTGVETLKKMSEMDHLNKDVPVVALTADAEPGAQEYYAHEGFTEYMAKPLDPAKYETMLVRLIPADKIQILDDCPDEAV